MGWQTVVVTHRVRSHPCFSSITFSPSPALPPCFHSFRPCFFLSRCCCCSIHVILIVILLVACSLNRFIRLASSLRRLKFPTIDNVRCGKVHVALMLRVYLAVSLCVSECLELLWMWFSVCRNNVRSQHSLQSPIHLRSLLLLFRIFRSIVWHL